MTMPTARATIAKIIDREERTGDVWPSNLLEAVVGLLRYTEALEQRVATLEAGYASTSVFDWDRKPSAGLGEGSVPESVQRPVAASQRD